MLKLHNAKAHKIAFLGFAPTASTKLILRLHCHRSRDSAELEPCLARLWLRLHCTPFYRARVNQEGGNFLFTRTSH